MRWFIQGSNLLASVCLLLAALAGALGFVVPDWDSALQTTILTFAAVLTVVGLSVFGFNVLNPGGGEADPASR